MTVAEVDDKVRLQKVETWFDPMEMFRQIAPQGVVNRQIMDHKVSKSDALEDVATNDGVKIAEAHDGHTHDKAPEDVVPKTISKSTGKPADEFVPHQGAVPADGHALPQVIATDHDASKTTSDVLPSSTDPAQTHNLSAQPERTSSPHTGSESSDKTWEKVDRPEETKTLQGDHPQDMEDAVKPQPGEAVVADPQSEETRATHEEMSTITPMECPFLMNRE